jgi:Protein of unknown function (DUF3108)
MRCLGNGVLSVSLLLISSVSLVRAADQLTGFPFQNETLRYHVNWPGGHVLGDVTLTATQSSGNWNFGMSMDVAVPIVPIADRYKASSLGFDLCSASLDRQISRGSKKVTERTEFDQKQNTAERRTLVPATETKPAGGGTSQLQIPTCGRDALTFLYWARRELGQGRVPAAGKVFLGSGYDVKQVYTGAMDIPVAGKPTTTDHVNVSVKGPASDFTFEMFYARDAARTPLLIKIPVAIGTVSLELVR